MAIIKSGSVAIVTGGASGIGAEFVKLLNTAGVKVTIADLTYSNEAQAFVNNHPSNTIFVKTDVTSWADLNNLFKVTIETFGTIDLLCPNAGVFEMSSSNFWYPPGSEESKDKVEESRYGVLDINVTHPIRLTQMGIEYFMKEKKEGHVLLVSSIAAQTATAAKPMYCASKAAISMFTRSLAPLADPPKNSGIPRVIVNAMAPGMVYTPLWTTDQDDMKGWMAKDGPFEWLGPEEVAKVMLDMVMKDEYKGGQVVERTKGKSRVVEVLMDEGTPKLKKMEAMTMEQKIKLNEETNAPVFKALGRVMGK